MTLPLTFKMRADAEIVWPSVNTDDLKTLLTDAKAELVRRGEAVPAGHPRGFGKWFRLVNRVTSVTHAHHALMVSTEEHLGALCGWECERKHCAVDDHRPADSSATLCPACVAKMVESLLPKETP